MTTVRPAPILPSPVPTASTARPSGAADGPGLSGLGLAALLMGPLLSILDFFIVNVALPTISRDLSAPAPVLELIVAGYGLGYALLLVVGGRLGDTWGRRRLATVGIIGFTVASLACGVAPSALLLVVFRVVQGVGAAMVVPQTLATIQSTLTGPARARALGLYGAVAGLGSVSGQLLGGVLVSADIAGLGWRPIFLVNVPVGIVALVMLRRTVPETRSTDPAPVDVPGTLLLAAVLSLALVPLLEGRPLGWPWWTWVMLALAVPGPALFARVERQQDRHGKRPLIPPSLLAISSVRRGMTIGVPFFAAFGGFMFVIALVLQGALAESALESGLALTPAAVGFFLASLSSPRLVSRFGNSALTFGAAVQAAGLLITLWTVITQWPNLSAVAMTPGMLVLGLGQGMLMTPLFRVILSEVPQSLAGVGSGTMITMQQASLAFGAATLGTLYVGLSSGSLGARGGLEAVLVIQLATAVIFGVGSRFLPRRVG